MYNYTANVTYLNEYDKNNPNETIPEIQEYREQLYKMDLLKAFGITDYTDNINTAVIQDILPLYINNKNIITLIDLSKQIWITDDNLHGFIGLFAYDYFYYLHRILQCIYNNQPLDGDYDILYNKLIVHINKS